MPKRQPAPAAILWVSHLLLAIASPTQASPPQVADISSPQRNFLGPEGNPLPFQRDDEILEFLETAEVIDEEPIGTGVNDSKKVLLERDGVRAHAAFREADVTHRDIHVGDLSYRVFHDSYLFEPAAYQLALRLGITNIPPAVRRHIGRRDGSLQLWIEGVLDEEEDGFKPPNIGAWVRQVRDMILFDNFICNTDRNGGNILVTPNYRLMMIDHTRAFQEKLEVLNPQRLSQVNETTWEKLRALTPEAIRDAVRPYLTPPEMSNLVRRHDMIIEHLEALIRTRGEDVVVRP